MRPIAVINKRVKFRVKFRDPCLNRSREITHEAVRGGIFDSFFVIHYERKWYLVIQGQTVLEIFEKLIVYRTNAHDRYLSHKRTIPNVAMKGPSSAFAP